MSDFLNKAKELAAKVRRQSAEAADRSGETSTGDDAGRTDTNRDGSDGGRP